MFPSNYTICTLWPCLDDPDPIWTQISSSVFCGLCLGFLIAADVYGRIQAHVTRQLQTIPDWDEETLFAEQYFDELEALPYWSEKEVKAEAYNWRAFWLTEDTPRGKVVLSYNHDLETFVYYTDDKSKIPFAFLDAIARKYAVVSECPNICVNAQLELEAAKTKYIDTLQAKEAAAAAAAEQHESVEKPVFAKLKKYNKTQGKGMVGGVQKDVTYIVRDRSNRFKWLGALQDYEAKQTAVATTPSDSNVKVKMSYADFIKHQHQQ